MATEQMADQPPQITATASADDPRCGVLTFVTDDGARTAPCVFGRSGVIAAADKREGDGATPLGAWPLRRTLYRADRIAAPQTALPRRPIGAHDGWCDAPEDPAYNRPVRRPYPAGHEVMQRADGLYDLLVVLGHNDDPPQRTARGAGLGSAIFLHCAKTADGQPAQPDTPPEALQPTEGCIALARDHLRALLARADRHTILMVQTEAPHARHGRTANLAGNPLGE